MNERPCLYCKKTFTPTKKHPNTRYCSKICTARRNAEQQRLPLFTCAECGRSFKGLYRDRRFCSRECSGIASNRNRVYASVADRFWLKVQKTNTCWLWVGAISAAGYGQLSIGHQKPDYAHRVSWILHYGALPDGAFVCHHCDNPRCVRPDHLFLGTPKDNIQDMVLKDRHSRGERRRNHKLTDTAVRVIRRSRLSNVALAKRYGVSPSTVSNARARKTWKHIP